MDRRRGKGPRRGLYPELSPSSVSRFRFFPRVNLCRSSCSLTLFLALFRPACKWNWTQGSLRILDGSHRGVGFDGYH